MFAGAWYLAVENRVAPHVRIGRGGGVVHRFENCCLMRWQSLDPTPNLERTVSIRDTIARNTGFNAAGRLWEALVALVLTRYIVDAVGVPAFGVWALVSVFTGYVALADFGVGSAYVKYIAEHAARRETREISAVVTTGTAFYLVLGAVVVAVGWPCVNAIVALFEWFGMVGEQASTDLRFLLRGGLLLFAATNLTASFTAIQTGLQRMGVTTVISFAASIAKIVATIAFLETGFGVRGLLYASAISLAVFALASVVAAFHLVPGLRLGPAAFQTSTLRRLAHFGIRARANGWMALGFQPGRTMLNADIIIGYIQAGQVHISDEFGTGAFGPHVPDTTLGGTFDIIDYGGSNDGTFTVLEFSRNLATGDEFDIELTAGANNIIWSYGPTTDTERQHIVRGYGEIELQ